MNIFIDEYNFKKNNNHLKVYENYDNNLLPIIKEMASDNFHIRSIEIINQKKYLLYNKYDNLLYNNDKKLNIEIKK